MDGEFARILGNTRHANALDSNQYIQWLVKVLPLLDRYLVHYGPSKSHPSEFVAELMRSTLDLANPVNDAERASHVLNFNSPLPGSENFATGPVELFTRIVDVLVRARHHVRVFSLALRVVSMPDPASFCVAPLPHGWIIHQHDRESGRLVNVCAIGNCLGDHDLLHTWHGRELSLICTVLTRYHALLSLLESWRLGHDDAQRYLWDLANAAHDEGMRLETDDHPP